MKESQEVIELPKRKTEEDIKCNVFLKAKNAFSEEIQKITDKKGAVKIAIFTHPSPDPDAIGSQMALSWLLRKSYDCEVDCFYDGNISHPQNQRMVNLLDPELKIIEDCDLISYDICIAVDTIPSHSVCPEKTIFNFVIDHHKETPNNGFKGFFLNVKAGSCCSTIYRLIKEFGASFEEDNALDSKVATALLIGIITDTEYQTSDDTTELDHEAYAELFNFRNSLALKQITKYKHPKEWVQARANVANCHDKIKDGILVHGVGFLTGNNRDLISFLSDEILSWEGVETCVVFAIIDGSKVEGSVRSENPAVNVPLLCKELGMDLGGNGGGKLQKGGFVYSLGSFSVDGEIKDSIRDKMWEFIKEREIDRLYNLIRN